MPTKHTNAQPLFKYDIYEVLIPDQKVFSLCFVLFKTFRIINMFLLHFGKPSFKIYEK